MQARAEHLVGQGLARRDGQRIVFARNLLDTLNRRDLDAAGERMAKEFALPYAPSKSGEFVAGSVCRQVQLASGRFAMIDNGLGFAPVPWTPALDNRLGKHVSGVMRGDGGVNWSMGGGVEWVFKTTWKLAGLWTTKGGKLTLREFLGSRQLRPSFRSFSQS